MCYIMISVTMTAVYYVTFIGTYQPADGRFTKSVYVGSNISLSVTKLDMDINHSLVTWKRFLDLDVVDSSLEDSMGKLTHDVTLASSQDADVYGTLTSGDLSNHGQSFIRLIVIVCPRGRWDPPSCLGVCDNCYNGGICHQNSGTCICPPGFSGKNCLGACGKHRYGWQCELECGPGYALDQCAGSQVCLPDPYGCNCLSGYTEIYCNETCQEGKFGVDCLQDCHCSLGSSCDPYTGSCSGGCEDGWSGPSCQVPSVCVQGYYGENCTEKCHCLDGRPCEKATGSCLDSKGECAVGYIPNAEGIYDNCRLFSGCYDSCLSTCHCSGGAPDCNSVTGSCLSNNCSLRWTGEKCQTDRFSIESEKTNPGLALVHCSFSTVDKPLPSGGINIAHNDTIIDRTLMTSNYSTTDNASRMSFFIRSVGVDDILYCTFGLNLVSQRPLVYARAPEREYYVLPELASTPNISEVGVQHVFLTWRQWDPDSDIGDGPVIGYFIYIRTSASLVRIDWIPSPTSEPRRNRNSSISVGQLTNETIHHNITNLESDTTYLMALSVVREGMNGEGSEGENIQIITLPIPTTAPPETPSIPPHTTVASNRGVSRRNNATAIAAGSAVGALFVMVIVVIVIIRIVRQRRRKNNGGRDDNPLHMHHSMNDYREGVTFPGTDEVDGQEQVILPVVVSLRKPNVPDKPLVDLHTAKPAHVPPIKQTVTLPDKKPISSVEPIAKLERIPVAEFPAFVQRSRHTSFFSEEFSSLPSGIQFRQTVAERPINREKNRYKNILPYDSTRVILEPINDDPQTDYFNASYIPNFKNARAYIASQGPNKASVDDFWRMIWQEKVVTIAMVTNLREGNKDDECRSLRQFHYTEWPDKGVPRHTSSLLKFLREVQADHGQTEAPLLIHCSAGVGRTGVVIGIDGIVAEAKATGFVDVFNFVSTMRQNRPQMVQTSEQYEFLYGAVIEDLLFEDTSVPIPHFASHLRSLKEMIHREGLTGLSKEFQNLQLLCPDPPESVYRSGLMPANQSKNRYGNILPLQRNRVILQSQDSSEDYINASFVKGVYCNFITTEMPMSNTVSDFWAMIYDYQPKCIVMLNSEEEDKRAVLHADS